MARSSGSQAAIAASSRGRVNVPPRAEGGQARQQGGIGQIPGRLDGQAEDGFSLQRTLDDGECPRISAPGQSHQPLEPGVVVRVAQAPTEGVPDGGGVDGSLLAQTERCPVPNLGGLVFHQVDERIDDLRADGVLGLHAAGQGARGVEPNIGIGVTSESDQYRRADWIPGEVERPGDAPADLGRQFFVGCQRHHRGGCLVAPALIVGIAQHREQVAPQDPVDHGPVEERHGGIERSAPDDPGVSEEFPLWVVVLGPGDRSRSGRRKDLGQSQRTHPGILEAPIGPAGRCASSHVLGTSGVADGRRPALFEFLPMLPTEEAAESSRERRPFIVCRIGVQDKRSLWRGQ